MYGKTSLENQNEISNKAKISYEISLRTRHRDDQLLGVNGGCLGTNLLVVLPGSIRNGQRLTGMSSNQATLPLAGSIFKTLCAP